MALCPAHDDAKGSLSVRVQTDAKSRRVIRPHCFAKCEKDAVLAAMNLTWRDLYVDGAPPMSERTAQKRASIEWVLDAEYEYTDETGEVEFVVVRKVPADGAIDKAIHQKRPVPGRPGEWALSLGRGWYTRGRDDQWRLDPKLKEAPGDRDAVYLEAQRPLIYRLGDLAANRLWTKWPMDDGWKGKWLVVCEGEKKVDALYDLMLPATTNAQGAGKWLDGHADFLTFLGVKRVILSPDNDPVGGRHMYEVARTCWARKIEVFWATLPELAPKGDVADFLVAQDCPACR